MQPMCVQTALNALKSPEFGWVTTTFSLVKILPLPTGISLVVASAEPCAPPVLAPPPDAEEGADAAPVAGGAAALVPAEELPEPPEPQALTAPARPTRPTPASTPRRVLRLARAARVSCCGSCVTRDPLLSVGSG